jgi:hypothetical protein
MERKDVSEKTGVKPDKAPYLALNQRLALAGFGGFLHLPFFGHDRYVQQAERQNHHHEYECHAPNIVARRLIAKITVVLTR